MFWIDSLEDINFNLSIFIISNNGLSKINTRNDYIHFVTVIKPFFMTKVFIPSLNIVITEKLIIHILYLKHFPKNYQQNTFYSYKEEGRFQFEKVFKNISLYLNTAHFLISPK